MHPALLAGLVVLSVGACAALEPESRVTPGMTFEQVQALVGPPRVQFWRYELSDQKIEIFFAEDEGAWSFLKIQQDSLGDTHQVWTHDGPQYATRFACDPTRVSCKREWEDHAATLALPVVHRDSPDKVRRILGPPTYMEVHFKEPLFGHFRDGKLVAWYTTPQSAIP